MSINLLDLLKSEVGSQLLGPAASFLGESEASTNKALGGILPSILGGLMDKGSDSAGAGNIMDMLKGADPSLLNNIGSIFGGGNSGGGLSSLLTGGSGVLGMLFGNNKLGSLIDVVTSFSGMKKSSSSTLLKLVAPFIMSAIGGKVKNMGLDALGLSKLLGEQKSFVKDALPAGFGNALGLSSLGSSFMDKASDMAGDALGSAKGAAETTLNTAKNVGNATANVAKDAGNIAVDTGKKGANIFMKWLLPALLALIVLGYLGSRGCNTGIDAVDKMAEKTLDATESVTSGAVDAVGSAAGSMVELAGDALSLTGDALKGAFGTVNNVAKAALDKIEFTTGSIGDQFMSFIDGGFSGENRFRFSNLTFASGSSVIDATSAVEVSNLAAILNAYTGVKIIIEGYTDSSGDQAANVQLSLNRANAVKDSLVAQGISADRIAVEGYGSANPIASNDTPEGMASNRRIEVRVIK
jgi:OmpA-OmpF porin, OOP family